MRMHSSHLQAALLLCASSAAAGADNGIYVAPPKLYDDFALQQMLRQAEASMATVEAVKSETLLAAIGKIQGAQLQRNQFGLSALESATPSGSTQTTATGTTTQVATSAMTPSVPAVTVPPEITLPSAFNPSALDSLDEMLQLNLALSNLRLLLRGSLTDQASNDGSRVVARNSYTFGFPVSIATPAGRTYRDAVAEIEVTVQVDDKCTIGDPGLKMVLPREKTYNVSQMKSSSVGIGAGVVAGIFTLGGNWIRGQSRYFLVRDQDTMAFERSSTLGPKSLTFGWQFKPVLGQRKVQPGLRQVFAQLTFPTPPQQLSLGVATVTTRWRRFERKTGAVGKVIPGSEHRVGRIQLKRLDQSPGPLDVDLIDIGAGKLRVAMYGDLDSAFFEGTTFRLAGSSQPLLEVKDTVNRVELDVDAAALVQQGLLVGIRGRGERQVLSACVDSGLPIAGGSALSIDANELASARDAVQALPTDCPLLPSVEAAKRRIVLATSRTPLATGTLGRALCGDRTANFKIDVSSTPHSAGLSRVRIELDKWKPPGIGQLPLLTLVGDKVFGLKATPYERYAENAGGGGGFIEFLIDSASLSRATSVHVVRPLWGRTYSAQASLSARAALAVTKVSTINDGEELFIALEGANLDGAKVLLPSTGVTTMWTKPDHALFRVEKSIAAKLKQIALQLGDAPLVFVDVSKASTPPPKPVIGSVDPVAVGTSVQVPLTWTNEGALVAVSANKVSQAIVSSDKNRALISLEDSLTARPGRIPLVLKFESGVEIPVPVRVVNQVVGVAGE